MVAQSSGVPQLDQVLGGGIPTGDLVLVTGAAGSGKTTLALQMAFDLAARGEVACFVSSTSESPKRLLEHARTYHFYDESQVGKGLVLLNVFPLIQEGLEPVRHALEREVRAHDCRLLVLDGLMTMYDLHPEPREVRRFLYELTSLLSTLGCTLLITSSRADQGEPAQAAELTMADVLIRLEQRVQGTRAQRTVQVVKVRGQTPLGGVHAVRLDYRGLAVFPRFESLARPADTPLPAGRTSSGLPELDEMLFGGLPVGSVSVLAGSVGTGKTLLSLQFLLDGAQRGEAGMLMSLRETEAELVAKARGFELDLETPIRDGRIRIAHHSPVDLSVDETMHGLIQELEEKPVQRFVLEGIMELLEPIPEEVRRRALMHVIAEQLASRGISAMVPVAVSQAVGPELDLRRTPLATLAHNLLLMRYVGYQGELHRILSVLKIRDSDFDASIRRYMISSEGLHLLARADTDEGLLSGISHLASEARVKRAVEADGER
jgi:circadian clock protein KaiC